MKDITNKQIRDLVSVCAALIDAVKYYHSGDVLTGGDKLEAAKRRLLKIIESLGPEHRSGGAPE